MESNFLLYAAKHYDNPSCFDEQEFLDDLKRIKYIKRLMNKYKTTGELKERLILNHIITLYNVFGEAATKMLFLKLEGYHDCLKPFLILIGRLPNTVENVGSENIIYTSSISLDPKVIELLRKV